jgi:hypothetical protein
LALKCRSGILLKSLHKLFKNIREILKRFQSKIGGAW